MTTAQQAERKADKVYSAIIVEVHLLEYWKKIFYLRLGLPGKQGIGFYFGKSYEVWIGIIIVIQRIAEAGISNISSKRMY